MKSNNLNQAKETPLPESTLQQRGTNSNSEDATVVENPFQKRNTIPRTPPRQRTISLPDLDREKETDNNSSKRKRVENSPSDSTEEASRAFMEALSQITTQVELLEITLKKTYNPKKELCQISSRLSLHIDKLHSGPIKKWLKDTPNQDKSCDIEKELQMENERLRKQISHMEAEVNEKLKERSKAPEEKCEKCERAQVAKLRRDQLKKEESYDSFCAATEDDWNSEVFATPSTGKGQIWDAPNDSGIVLLCNNNIESRENNIRRAIEKFGGREGLRSQYKKEGDVAMMCHSLGFPDQDGNVSQNIKWIYYPIITDQAVENEKTDKQIFQSLITVKDHATRLHLKKLAIPEMQGAFGTVIMRMLIYLLADTGIKLVIYNAGLQDSKMKKEETTRGRIDRLNDVQATGTYTKKKTPRQDALLVQTGDKSYADMLKIIKESINPIDIGVEVKTIRKSKNNDVIVTVQSGSSGIEALKQELERKVPEAKTQLLIDRKTLHIKGMDETITKEEIVESVSKAINKEAKTFEVRALRPAFGNTQNATLIINEEDAEKLLKANSLRVGWTKCRVIERAATNRCPRCWEYGHSKGECTGPNREKLCWRCSAEGHRASECKNKPFCLNCKLEGHQTGTRNCRDHSGKDDSEVSATNTKQV